MTERLHFHFSLSCIGEGNGNPLECSCLENPRDGGAWWAAVYWVAQSLTRLKWLSSSSSSNAYIWTLEKWYWRIYLQGNNGEADIENRHGHWEKGGEGEIYGKSNLETYITICKIDSQLEFAIWLRKLKQGLCVDKEWWDGEGDGREVQKEEDICIPMADSCWGFTENSKIL